MTFKIIKGLIKLFIKFCLSIIFNPVKNKFLFKGFGDLYIDNSKSLFEYLNKNSNLNLIWTTNNKSTYHYLKKLNINVVRSNSIIGIYHALTCNIHFFGDYKDFFVSKKSITVNLWHGIPLKKIEFDISKGPLKELYNHSLKSKILFPHLYSKTSYLISSSEHISKKILSKAFNIKANRCLNFGLPRNEKLFDKNHEYQNKLLNSKKYNKIYTYLPTWRYNENTFLDQKDFDLNKLQSFLSKTNSLFLIKIHPKCSIVPKNSDNIIFLDNNVDLYSVLSFTDVLITDYSSVIFDFMLTNKKIIYYAYDLDEYTNTHDLYFDYKEIITSEICRNFYDLLKMMEIEYIDISKYTILSKKIWGNTNHNSNKNISEYFITNYC